MLIEAGPGAGKTFVLVERVKFLIKSLKVDPESLLVITFTNKAADELKERLGKDPDIGYDLINQMQISTIHSFCTDLLSQYNSSGLTVIDDDNGERKKMYVSKHWRDFGFNYEYFVPKYEMGTVIDKFDEFTTFEVDTDELIKYINKEFPLTPEYINFIEDERVKCGDYFKFPEDDIKLDDNLKNSWYDAKYLAIVKAYNKYKELLEKENCVDFNFLQIKALELLENKEILENVPYTNILIDEFQDTDPIQMQIFDKLMENYDSFTVVGDDDQSIYGFRGALPRFFNEFHDKYNSEVITLQTNYRSTPNIVEVNESFIGNNRESDSAKKLIANRDDNSTVFYLANENKKDEADNIVEIVKYLKASGKINNYSDVGILFRAINGGDKSKIEALINKFNVENIPFDINGNPNLIEQDEVKSVLLLLWYTCKMHKLTKLSRWEEKWLNLKSFNSEYFDFSEVFDLSDETKDVLANIENNYQKKVVETQKVIAKERGVSVRSKYHTVYKNDTIHNDEILEEIFKNDIECFDIGLLNEEKLKKLGITNPNDLNFFTTLNTIKQEFYNPDIELDKKDTILQIFYKLLNINNYLKTVFDSEDEDKRYNIALISNIIYNYEKIVDKHDLVGLFYYLTYNLDKYSCPNETNDDEDYVNISTIHSAKGLEYPVVIIGSFEEDVFPRKYDEEKIKERKFGAYSKYYYPNEFFKYKNQDTTLEEKLYIEEENRTIYVAMTRAQDLLILSSIPHKIDKDNEVNIPTILKNLIEDNPDLTKVNMDDLSNLTSIKSSNPLKKQEVVNLSYTQYANFDSCPHRYNLSYIYNFKLSDSPSMAYGTIAHNILNRLNIMSKKSKITKEDINKVIKENLENNLNIDPDNEDAQIMKDNIFKYWAEYGEKSKVLGSEIPFTIAQENYNLNGQIDLITQGENNTINILDYKNTDIERVTKYKNDYVKQLNIYYNAVKEKPEFKDYDINSINIYALKSNELKPMEIDLNEINNIKLKLGNVASKIINKEFPENTQNCGWCDYRYMCKQIEIKKDKD